VPYGDPYFPQPIFSANVEGFSPLYDIFGNQMIAKRKKAKNDARIGKADSPVLKGYQLYHNYFREHEGLGGMTPAEAGE